MTDTLTDGDFRYWAPIPAAQAWLASIIPDGSAVLDVGPNHAPFARATVLADMLPRVVPGPQEFIQCEVGAERLPFPDKHFDFVYCRHAVEDMTDPFPAIREIERVGKAGYIETPSPLAELCRGVDGDGPPWRGYNHHHWLVWEHDGALRLVTKFPAVEYLAMNEIDIAGMLRTGPRYWNTYHLWRDKISVAHHKPTTNFTMPTGYPGQLSDALRQSVAATDAFWARMAQSPAITQAA